MRGKLFNLYRHWASAGVVALLGNGRTRISHSNDCPWGRLAPSLGSSLEVPIQGLFDTWLKELRMVSEEIEISRYGVMEVCTTWVRGPYTFAASKNCISLHLPCTKRFSDTFHCIDSSISSTEICKNRSSNTQYCRSVLVFITWTWRSLALSILLAVVEENFAVQFSRKWQGACFKEKRPATPAKKKEQVHN